MNPIEVEHLTRDYDGVRAVDDLSFHVEPGEIFGFLGPNGAGKTTTIKLLTGQLRPTQGTARVAGYDVRTQTDHIQPYIGVVFEQQNLYERLSGRENLAFSAQLYGVSSKRIDEVLEHVRLASRAGDRVQKYSNGMKQRLLIARALLHRPQILFLDEPTRGLDPDVAQDIRALITDLVAEGMTVFLTTHYMEEADQLCRRVAFIDAGHIVALDTPGSLKIAHGKREVSVELNDGQRLALALDDAAASRRLGELAASGHIRTLHSSEATLEEVFVHVTHRSWE